jgi:hypothetical protein
MFQFYKEALRLLIVDTWNMLKPHICTSFSVSYATDSRKCVECGRVDLNTPPLKFDVKHGDN